MKFIKRFIYNFLILFFGFQCGLNGQTWYQTGNDITGEGDYDYAQITAISGDGTTVIVGANEFNHGHGYARVYKNIEGIWTQIGQKLIGENDMDRFGTSVSINTDGTIIAVGATYNSSNALNAGHVRVYEFNSGVWTQIGQDIDGEQAHDNAGISVDLNHDGTIVAVGSYHEQEFDYHPGQVRIFKNVSGEWIQIGEDLYGEAAGDKFGCSLSIDSTGNIIAIGGYGNDDNGQTSGSVRLFQNTHNQWIQIGSDIDGEDMYDASGYSVSLNSDGTVVAIGAYSNDDNGDASGQTRVYQNISGTWTKMGQDINGQFLDYSGYCVGINSPGNIVVIGSWHRNHVRVYKYNSNIWTQMGENIENEEGCQFGISVSISSLNNIVSIGSCCASDNFMENGTVKVFYYCEQPMITTQPLSQYVHPDSTVNFSIVANGTDMNYQWRKDSEILIDNDHFQGCTTPELFIYNVSPLDMGAYECMVSNSCGEDVSNIAQLNINSGIYENNIGFSIHPNPVKNIVYLNLPPQNYDYYIDVIDILGHKCISGKIVNGKSVDLSSLNSGAYIIQIHSHNNVFIEKIIKE